MIIIITVIINYCCYYYYNNLFTTIYLSAKLYKICRGQLYIKQTLSKTSKVNLNTVIMINESVKRLIILTDEKV